MMTVGLNFSFDSSMLEDLDKCDKYLTEKKKEFNRQCEDYEGLGYPEMVLKIEKLPSKIGYNGLRYKVPSFVWDSIRHKVYESNNHKCTFCNKKVQLHAHEVFDFDSNSGIACLSKIIPVCELCHSLIHYGRSKVVHNHEYINEIWRNFANVNKLSGFDSWTLDLIKDIHEMETLVLFMKRDKIDWIIDWNSIKQYLI